LRRLDRPLLLLPLAFALIVAGEGCAHYQVNPRLAAYDPQAGYRYANLAAPDNSESLFVILAFSGGGTRAAALSYGVLEQLAKTNIFWEGRTRPLLSEVDVISSVSGGSFTAAYYALYGDRIFHDFESRFLKQQIQSRLVRNFVSPANWLRLPSPYFDRIDMAAEIYSRDIFDRKTFADLIRKGTRPYLILNATDMTLGARFEFTQDQFDLICSDLSGVPIARAVAASSAFPGLLSPLTLRSFAHDPPGSAGPSACGYKVPEWVVNAREDARVNARRYSEAETLLAYVEAPGKQFVHLVDGGISDNIGLRGPIRALTSNDSSWSLVNKKNNGAIKKVVVITVNAKPQATVDWDRREVPPRLLTPLVAAAETPIDHYSFETVELLKQDVSRIQEEKNYVDACTKLLKRKCPDATVPGQPQYPDYYTIEVNFDAVADEAQRRFFQGLATSFQLPPAAIDCLSAAGGALLAQSPDFAKLLDDLDAGARAAGVPPPPRPPAPDYPGPCGRQ
jgi:NTE family protein